MSAPESATTTAHGPGDTPEEHHGASLGMYLLIFGALLVLTGLTIGVAFMDLGAFNTPVALTIACIKGTLVVLYFMHVRYSSRLVWVFAAAGFLWLVILLGFTFSDYVTRNAAEATVQDVPAWPTR